MMKHVGLMIIVFISFFFYSFSNNNESVINTENVDLKKDLLFTKYTQKDSTKYNNKLRVYQWDKIAKYLNMIDSLRGEDHDWAVIRNYRNLNGVPPLTDKYIRNEYGNVADTLGNERYQGIPMYSIHDTIVPLIYGRDGWPVIIIDTIGNYIYVNSVHDGNEWLIPKRYLTKSLKMSLNKVIFVDRKNQNISTIEKDSGTWLVRSMNPATTGLKKPPHMLATPLGVYVIQEKKEKMQFLKDGTKDIAGYSPYASRFTRGGYIHGVPVNLPATEMKEWSYSLGTTPRSHMCVRNATSHAKFVYNWAKTWDTWVIVIE